MSKEQTKPEVDWEGIELEYRAGRESLREIAAKYPGVNHVAIMRRAKKEGWTQDLRARIQAKAEEMLARAAVEKQPKTEEQVATQNEVISAGAQKVFEIRTKQREHIDRARKMVMKLMDELEIQTDNLELFREFGETMFSPDDKGRDKLNELYHKVIDLPTRIKGMKELGEALKTLIGLEREAWGIEGAPAEGDNNDKPVDLNDVARRVAFTLARAASSQPTVH